MGENGDVNLLKIRFSGKILLKILPFYLKVVFLSRCFDTTIQVNQKTAEPNVLGEAKRNLR